jgi:nucleotide-binding universal stress UspA family protein
MDNKNGDNKKEIDRILVPVDFSDYSLNACFFALHLASRTKAEILLFHVFFNPMVDAMAFPDAFTYQSNMADIFKELEESAIKQMKKFSRKIKKYARPRNLENISIKTEVRAGQPGEEIDSIIKTFSPGIIVIGTRGHGEQANEVLGSVAARVIDSAGTPVLLVTQDARLSEEGRIKVLYATDFDESDYHSIGSLSRIMSGFDICIDCVHFSTKQEVLGNREKMSEMKKHLKKEYGNINLECHIIQSEDLLSGVNDFIEANDIELIALTHKKRNIFYRLFNPSLAKKLLFQTKRPVFVFN